MALTPNTWYYLTFAALADPPWTVPNYAVSGLVLDAIIGTTSVLCFCTADDGTNSTLLTFKNQMFVIPTAATSVVSTPAMNTSTLDDGETWYSIRDGGSGWYFYGDQGGLVRHLAVSAPLGIFIT